MYSTWYVHVAKRRYTPCCRLKVNSDCHIVGRLLNITVGLTSNDPQINRDPMNSWFWLCDTQDEFVKGQPIDLECDEQLPQGRYLFVAATVRDYFHLSEVEVYTGKLYKTKYTRRVCMVLRPKEFFHSNL